MMDTRQALSFQAHDHKHGAFCNISQDAVMLPLSGPGVLRTGAGSGEEGFTLVELMIIVAIIGIFAAIATLNFSQMNDKYRIESYTKEIHALLMRARNDAANTNRAHTVTLAANQIQVTSDVNGNGVVDANETTTTPFPRFAIQFPIAMNPIIFDRRGIVNDPGNQTMQIVHPGNSAPGVDCIVVSATRINVGRMTGGNCAQQ
jgi:prepilin-type N-terminal cleavage/methylation domain-containing protein